MTDGNEEKLIEKAPKRTELLKKITRRKVLKRAGVATVGGGVVGHELSESVLGWENTKLVVEQGDKCVPIEPLRDRGDVVEFYGYDPDPSVKDSQQSNTGLEKSGVSRMFLYDGPNGFSIVFIHGGGDGERGGAASFLICGLSVDGEWVVLDDNFDGATDEYLIGDQEAVLDWTWRDEGRNDGAVYRGFNKKFCVTIKPAFNENAKLPPSGPGEVNGWELVSRGVSDLEVIELDMDEPVTIRTGACEPKKDVKRCTMSSRAIEDPFDAEVTFCCTSVTVEADGYDAVFLNFLDGTEMRFDGPFEGMHSFLMEGDDDGNPHDEVVRSVVVRKHDDSVEVMNPNFDRCRKIAKGDEGGEGEPGY
jgi:hypothetical protein